MMIVGRGPTELLSEDSSWVEKESVYKERMNMLPSFNPDEPICQKNLVL
jgi:hypothetical protein